MVIDENGSVTLSGEKEDAMKMWLEGIYVGVYIERMLRFYSGGFKQDKILKFFSSNPSSQKSHWDADRQHVNSVLQDGELE